MRAECEKREKDTMPERREEDMEETRPISLRNVIPSIPTDDRQVKELKEDLRAMRCIGLLSRPWNLQAEDALRDFFS